MLAAGHAGQGRHQWDVSIAGAQRVAYVSFADTFWSRDTDVSTLACEYTRNHLPSHYVRRQIHCSHPDQKDLHCASEELCVLVGSNTRRPELSRLFCNVHSFYLCLLAKREDLDPSRTWEVHLDECFHPRYFGY